MKFFVSLVLLVPLLVAHDTEAKKAPVIKRIEGSFLTNVTGSSVTRPPYIQVLRSKAGLEYTISRFERLKNKITQARINRLLKRLARINYSKYMLVGIFSQPMDNYKMTLDKMTVDEGKTAVEVKVTYLHKIRNMAIPPKKSIHYIIAVTPRSDLPVVLRATEVVTSKNAKPVKLVTVTGRLMQLSDGNLQLVPVVIRRGSKNSYYIKGAQAGPLARHVGKVVKLRGSVSRERNGPYEWDMTVKKVVKVYP